MTKTKTTIFPVQCGALLRRCATTVAAVGLVLPAAAAPSAFNIVEESRPATIIVTADQPTAVAAYAAQELVSHVEKATGVKLQVVAENNVPSGEGACIYLGDTRAARQAGINVRDLAPETFVLRSGEKVLYIAGNDAGGDPLDINTSAGTLFGVYELLERELGVRWAWPGDLGTFVPKARTVMVKPVDETISPRFFQRHVRAGLGFAKDTEHPALGFTAKAAAEYAKEQTVFLRRHRMGRSYRLNYGHDAFKDWWKKYGAEHPEWFQLVNGKRGPVTPTSRFSMCVSNPGLHRKIVELWREKGGADPRNGPSFINAVDNDILGLCECESCQAWDGPSPPDKDTYYLPKFKMHGARFVSDRYARFVLAVQDLAAKENPEVTAIGYAYFNYFQAPTSGVKLNSRILLAFSPSAGWYPRFDDEHEWHKRQWTGWRETGARLFFRPDYFLDGYCMPFIFAHQFADDFQHAVRNDCAGTDYDSLTGQWATQGPTLYLLMRLHTRPEANPDDLLAEYYCAFGPAAPQVKDYFDYWERYTMDNRPLIFRTFEDRVAMRWRTWARVPHRIFPEECFAPAETLLGKAAAAAVGDEKAAARVKFLQTGLSHAKLSARAAGLLTLSDPASSPERGWEALGELIRFRRAHEREWIGNFNHSAWVEDKSWTLGDETKQPAETFP